MRRSTHLAVRNMDFDSLLTFSRRKSFGKLSFAWFDFVMLQGFWCPLWDVLPHWDRTGFSPVILMCVEGVLWLERKASAGYTVVRVLWSMRESLPKDTAWLCNGPSHMSTSSPLGSHVWPTRVGASRTWDRLWGCLSGLMMLTWFCHDSEQLWTNSSWPRPHVSFSFLG
jgi:hypothetical protein